MSDRKPLISKNDTIINNLTQFYSEITEFEKSVRDIGTSRDTTTFRGILHKKKINLGDDLKVMSQQIKQLPQSGQSKVQQDKIIKQFKEAHSKFEELLSLSNKKEQQHEPIVPSVQQPVQQPIQQQNNNNNTRGGYGGYGNNINNNVYNNNNNNGGYDYQTNGGGSNEADIDRLEQALQENTLEQDNQEFYGRIIDERNAQTKALAQDMLMLNEAMKDVQVMVGEQGVLLEKADDNVEKADHHVEDAVVELEKAYVYKTSYRKKMVILIFCLIITAAAVGLFLAIYFGVIKKKGSSTHNHTDDSSSYSDDTSDSHHSSSSHHHSSSHK